MNTYSILTGLILMAALFGYLNARFLKLPATIGLMLITLMTTLAVVGLSYFDDTLLLAEAELIQQIDFERVLMDYMLSFLLFAGALHTNYNDLKKQAGAIVAFATLGVILSTFLIGTLTFYLLQLLGMPVDYVYCLLFGAIISPTDPIAVLGILKQAGAPKKLETKIVGESLFNDGVGVVIFLTLFQIAQSSAGGIDAVDVGILFGQEVFGGLLLGLGIGWLTYKLLEDINDFSTETIITLAAVMGGTLLAQKLHLSAPLAMVMAGLSIGHDRVRDAAMSEETELYVDKFWQLLDILLNAVLFVLIGMEMLVLTYAGNAVVAGLLAIPIVLLSRYASLWLPVQFFARRLDFVPYTHEVITWGGLRGGISIALALTLTTEMNRELFLVMTYVVVIFSILVQGLTIERLVKRLFPTKEGGGAQVQTLE